MQIIVMESRTIGKPGIDHGNNLGNTCDVANCPILLVFEYAPMRDIRRLYLG